MKLMICLIITDNDSLLQSETFPGEEEFSVYRINLTFPQDIREHPCLELPLLLLSQKNEDRKTPCNAGKGKAGGKPTKTNHVSF